tara:strand:- start:382 stop:651 length:270 start_codon:yes stop_codon:yes gene_type:complete
MVPELADKNLVSPQFVASMQGIEQQLKYVETVPPSADQKSVKASPMRRFIIWSYGIMSQIRMRVEGVVEFGRFYGVVNNLFEILKMLFM